MVRFAASTLLLALCLSEVVLVFIALGGSPTADSPRLGAVVSTHMSDPNPQTEQEEAQEAARYHRRELTTQGIFALLAVLNTAALMRTMRYSRMRHGAGLALERGATTNSR